ncbi:MAG: tetratricopeptide repeat protein [Flammeovirgaceae bacterium]
MKYTVIIIAYCLLIGCSTGICQPKSGQALVDSLNLELTKPTTTRQDSVGILNSLAFNLRGNNKALALEKATLAQHIAQEIDDQAGLADAYNSFGVIYWEFDGGDSASFYYEQAIAIYQKLAMYEKQARSKVNLAVLYGSLGEYDKAIQLYDEALQLIEIHKFDYLTYIVLLNKGIIYRRKGDYPNALELFLIFSNYANQEGHQRFRYVGYYNVADVYRSMENYTESAQFYRKALKMAQERENDSEKAKALRVLGSVFKETDQIDSAKVYYEQALTIYKRLGKASSIGACLASLGSMEFVNKNYEKTLKYHHASLKYYQTTNKKVKISTQNILVGNVYLALNRLDSASFYMNKGWELAKETEDNLALVMVNEGLKDLYAAKKMYKEAFMHQKAYYELNDSIINEEKIREISQLEAKYNYENEKQQLLIQQEKEVAQFEKRQQIMLIAGGSLAILAIILFRSYRIKQKDNRLLAKQSEELKAQAKALEAQAEALDTTNKQLVVFNQELVKAKEKEKELMESAILAKEQQLTTTMMASLEKNALLDQINHKVNKLSENVSKEIKPQLKEIKKIITTNKHLDGEWDSFLHQFENVHPNFFQSLQKNYPNLTVNEQKLCAYLKIGMHNKEIATILNVSPNTVYTQLYRLKKKLELPAELTMRDWVFGL